jgi:very-short-patch-repair endonuclease
VLDFYCHQARLCIEIDGATHGMGENPERDQRRDTWLRQLGVRTVRIAATDVLQNLDGVLRFIVLQCHGNPFHHSPLASGPPPLQGGLE